jgi:monoamine oxidase
MAEAEEDRDEIDVVSKPRTKVVIIGAGAAGLGAARWLSDNDLSGDLEVVVLEASHRIGGRVYTNTEFGVPVDLGASWLHDHEEGNPISIMATRLQLDLRNTEWDNSISLNSQGERLNEKIAARYWTVLEAAFCDSVKPTLDPLAAHETQSLAETLGMIPLFKAGSVILISSLVRV